MATKKKTTKNRYRVTYMHYGHRIASDFSWASRSDAEWWAKRLSNEYLQPKAHVVIDSARIREMIPERDRR
jgi:hypothetical protein